MNQNRPEQGRQTHKQTNEEKQERKRDRTKQTTKQEKGGINQTPKSDAHRQQTRTSRFNSN
eukprot:11213720-Lingulodinium_polyedra.AAC.1